MTDMDTNLIKSFAQSIIEIIENSEEDIFNMALNREHVNEVFRMVHNLKGSASMLKLKNVEYLSHNIETLLDKVRDGELPVSSNLIDLVLRSTDLIKYMLQHPEIMDEIEIEHLVFELANYGKISQISIEPEAFAEEDGVDDDDLDQPLAVNRKKYDNRFLVVDDEYIVRRTIKNLLATYFDNIDIDYACNGIEAIQAYQLAAADYQPFSLIFLDIEMPGKDGFEVTKRIRSIEQELQLPEVPILMVTALKKIKGIVKAYKEGCNDFVTKPFKEQEFIYKTRGLLAEQHQNKSAAGESGIIPEAPDSEA